MDESNSRKNAPTAHIVYGNAFAMNSGMYAVCDFVEEARKFCPEKGPEIYADKVMRFFRGTGIEIDWRMNKYCPTEQEYITMTMDKWYAYINISCALMKAVAKSNLEVERATRIFAMLLAICNDYSDFVRSKYSEGKDLCDDMAEGKFTLPTIHAVHVKGNKEVYGKITEICVKKSWSSCF